MARRFSYLKDIPETLYAKVISCTHGSLEKRVAGLIQWRAALLSGALPRPDGLAWPSEKFVDALLADSTLQEVAGYCREQTELVDAVLDSLLDAVASGDTSFRTAVERQLHELRKIEEMRRRAAAQARKTQDQNEASPEPKEGDETGPEPEALTQQDLDALHSQAEISQAPTWSEGAAGSIKKRWASLLSMWREISEVFGELGLMTGLGRDLSLGVLKSRGWLEAKKLADLLRQLPQLREIVRALGRVQTVREDDPATSEVIYQPVRRVREELREVWTPHVPSETRGIERSDAIARMLPSEAVLLTHPTLKVLWHARRAERSLLTYRVEGVATERVEIEEPSQEGTLKPTTRQKLERGPIIFCLDTSGSMKGAPEMVAKALVLEAVRTAHAELRQCYLYAFSGPGQVTEHELSLKPEGLEKLLSFLAMSFDGGTDVAAPLTKAADRLHREGWNKADIVLVSDGEFDVPVEVPKFLRHACTEKNARVHGVLVGQTHSAAMQRLCDPLHRFSDWDAMKLVR
ncbi:MAG: VWA domain-containing protein [Planctomycetes bacterium]|nr:VWA domain-containing protein [Planctomycetota bacterium]